MSQPTPVVEVTGATIRYDAGPAIQDVDVRLFPGEVHAILGENGAGKSTLIKAISGAEQLTAGTISLDGEPVRFGSPRDAQLAGIWTVYQEIELLPSLTVAENVMLGREPRRIGFIDWPRMREQTREILASLGLEIDPASQLGRHSLAIQQLVAIARAVSSDARVLILDEPTSSLDIDEVAELFRVLRELRQRGVAILFISHFLDQVYEIADRITVLRDGRLVGEYLATEVLRVDLVERMLGRRLDETVLLTRTAPIPTLDADNAILTAREVSVPPGIERASIAIAEGEVVGFAGLLGSGRTELAHAITGVDRIQSGVIAFGPAPQRLRQPRDAIKGGVVYSSENRRTEGIVGGLTVMENITLALQAQRGIWRRLPRARERELAASWVEALDIRPTDLDREASTLSGGNQQKVLLARLLALAPRVMVLDEPTRGIDIGAKVEITNLVQSLADNGLAVVFISAELEEVLRVSNRIVILREGRIVDVRPAAELTVESLTALVARPEDVA